MRPGGQARRASISGIFEPARPMFSAPLTGCSAGRMYRYIELRTLAARGESPSVNGGDPPAVPGRHPEFDSSGHGMRNSQS